MSIKTTLRNAAICGLLTLGAYGCRKDDNGNNGFNTPGTDSTRVRPGWGPTMSDSMLLVIERLQRFAAPPIESLTPAEARMQPTLTDAVKAVIAERNIAVPPSPVDTAGRDIPVAGGNIHARIYTPRGMAGTLPVIVYYQGGGWVIANLDVYDASCRGLAEKTGAIVVSVQYRKGPEFKFPTAHNDAFEAYRWVLANAGSFNGDPARVALAGESAGGNLACNVSIMARDNGVAMPRYQVLVYPVANNMIDAGSAIQYKDAKPLNRAMLMWFLGYYLNSMSESSDPRIKLVSANLSGLPPTMLLNAEIDPLRDDGPALEAALKAAGVTTTHKNYIGVTHEFFGAAAILPEARDAQNMAAAALKTALR